MKSVLEFLENSASNYPDKTAVIDEKTSVTYTQLIVQSKKAGTMVAHRGFKRKPIAVIMEKSINACVAFFGIVYSGNYYVMLNPELPEARLKQICTVLDAPLAITDEEHLALANSLFASENILTISQLTKTAIDESLLEKMQSSMTDTDPLYINFTSGSTGVPKGVVISHRGVIDFITQFTEIFDIQPNDIIGNQAPFDFDVSVKDIYSSLKVGATLVIIPRRLFSNPAGLLDFMIDHHITVMIWAVSALCLISAFHGLDYKVPTDVRKILFSGEVMPLKHLKSWMNHLPEAMFVNLYGPTEITCNCTYHIIERNAAYEDGIPIGMAFPNERVFLLDEENHEITDEMVTGEICVGGAGLALGYYNNPQQTEKHFIQNPLNPYYRELIYRTGDLGKYNSDGNLCFCGRKDFQIKHMGHRIELEEIEKAMGEIAGVERCCCVYSEAKGRIYGFYIGTIDKKTVHQLLKKTLPVFMIPQALRQVETLKMNKNGKIDRKALLEGVRHGK